MPAHPESELSLIELLQRTDEEIGRAAADAEEGRQGAEGRLAMAEAGAESCSPVAKAGARNSNNSRRFRCRESSG